MVGVDLGLNTIFEVLGRIAEVALDVVLRVAAHAFRVAGALCEALAGERIDLFLNNAGFGACGAFSETDAGKELSMLRVNVLAMHRLFKFTLRKMEAQALAPS